LEKKPPVPKLIFCLLLSVLFTACGPQPNNSIPIVAVHSQPLKKKVPPLDTMTLNYITGKFNPASDPDFVKINPTLADKPDMYMRHEAYGAFLKMYGAARSAGITLQIRSAARNFDYQKGIWERKWTGETILSSGENASKVYPKAVDRAEKILNYSSMPGTSRHHWGTDIDLNNFNNSWFESGAGLKLFEWLEANAHLYGYCRPYTAKDSNRPEGYNEEKWHWSYMPLSQILTDYAEAYLSNKMIKGFKGCEVADTLDVVKHYVLGINKGCRH